MQMGAKRMRVVVHDNHSVKPNTHRSMNLNPNDLQRTAKSKLVNTIQFHRLSKSLYGSRIHNNTLSEK